MVTNIVNMMKTLQAVSIGSRTQVSGGRKKHPNKIKTHIQRQLLLRLGVGGVIISAILSVAVFMNERHQISRQVIDKTRQGATRFNAQIETILKAPGLTDKDRLQEKLNILFIAARRRQETGHFVYIGIYDLAGDLMAVVSDSETDLHNYRVTIYAVRVAEALNRDAKSIRGLIKGAFLHDVGKIGVSDSILLKPGRLSRGEFEKIKGHVQHGVDIIKSSDWLYDAAEVVGYHHEQYSGNGYPFGLQGRQIPLNARIFAIADVFDALTSQRPYKEPYALEKTLEIMSDMRDSHFDPELLDAFIPIAGKLYYELAVGDDDAPHRELENIIRNYFKKYMAKLLPASKPS